jgi:hypothetical protein
MQVVSMALLEATRYFVAVLCVLFVIAARWWPPLVFFNALLLLLALYTLVVDIPLSLNWSRSMYGGLLMRFVLYVAFTIGIYAAHYYQGGLFRADKPATSWVDALYFSVTTWTTLGYGDIAATGSLRLATSLEALTGLLTAAVISALIWLYCSERLRDDTPDREKPGMKVRHDTVMGGYVEIESPEAEQARLERNRRLRLIACRNCGQRPILERFFDLMGRLAPFPTFVVLCSCGMHTKPAKNAYVAAWRWNRDQARSRPRG